MTVSLLATKFHIPSLPLKRVVRPLLVQRLNRGLETGRPITLVSAPAGFGKTTCVTEWVNGLDLPIAWLSLDAADDDPGHFFAYLIAALQQVDQKLGWEIGAVLQSGQLPPSEIISTTLINDIIQLDCRLLLILDDFHVIQDSFILQVLETLVVNQPRPLHLVLLTREDPPLPLARLRANNQLTEIRVGDLRFTKPDVDRFLSEVMNLSLSPADIAALENRTEGWIVGLQLAGFSIRDQANPSRFIATLSGSHRYILSYLTEEVLNRQPAETQQFLLQTSILDRLCGDLCNAVTRRSDSHSLLEQLLSANLFLIPLDDEQQWYRYHHLFADLLRNLQAAQQEKTTQLHQRASHWYAQAGLTNEAIQHALAAADHATAVQLLEEHATKIVMQGYAKTVDGWMQRIPPAWRSQSSKTNLAFAWMHALRGNYLQAFAYLELIGAALRADKNQNPSVQAEWLALQTLMLNMQGQAAEAMPHAKQALAIAPADDSHSLGLAYYALAGVYQLEEDYAKAMDAYQTAIQHGRISTNLVTEMMSVSALAVMALERGQLSLAFEVCSPAIGRIERSDSLPPIGAVVYGVMGQIQYQWYQLDLARSHFLRAIQLSALGGFNSGAIFYPMLLSRLLQLKGELDIAESELQKVVDLVQIQAPADLREEIVAQQVRLYLAQARPAAAEVALQAHGFAFDGNLTFPKLEIGSRLTHSTGVLYNSALRFLLYQAQIRQQLESLNPGLALADRLIAAALDGQFLLVALETLLLRSQMQMALNRRQASQADCAQALELAEPEGFITVFLEEGSPIAQILKELLEQKRLGATQEDHTRRILQAFAESPPPVTAEPATSEASAELIEPLTERELEVLNLIADGLKYQEIADKLFISLNTVRFYVKEIYGKLHVNNRTKAIALARQQKLI